LLDCFVTLFLAKTEKEMPVIVSVAKQAILLKKLKSWIASSLPVRLRLRLKGASFGSHREEQNDEAIQ